MRVRGKVRIPKGELEELCLQELRKLAPFADMSDVEVAPLLGNPKANWTIRRVGRDGILRRPGGDSWDGYARPALDSLCERLDLAA